MTSRGVRLLLVGRGAVTLRVGIPQSLLVAERS